MSRIEPFWACHLGPNVLQIGANAATIGLIGTSANLIAPVCRDIQRVSLDHFEGYLINTGINRIWRLKNWYTIQIEHLLNCSIIPIITMRWPVKLPGVFPGVPRQIQGSLEPLTGMWMCDYLQHSYLYFTRVLQFVILSHLQQAVDTSQHRHHDHIRLLMPPFVRGIHRSRAQRPVTRSFDVFIDLRWINGYVINVEAGDLRCHRVHYDVTVMKIAFFSSVDSPGDPDERVPIRPRPENHSVVYGTLPTSCRYGNRKPFGV